MDIKKSDFYITAVSNAQYPKDNRPEIAFIGRSNVGKSTIINTLTNRKGLARVSSAPGKTRVINFFTINEDFYFVDLPGYGFAKVSKQEQQKWGQMIEKYLVSREQLKLIVLLLDVRRKPSEDDKTMYEWVKHYGVNFLIVCTKADKVSRSEMLKNIKIIREELQLNDEDSIIPFSALKKSGKEEILNYFDEFVS